MCESINNLQTIIDNILGICRGTLLVDCTYSLRSFNGTVNVDFHRIRHGKLTVDYDNKRIAVVKRYDQFT